MQRVELPFALGETNSGTSIKMHKPYVVKSAKIMKGQMQADRLKFKTLQNQSYDTILSYYICSKSFD